MNSGKTVLVLGLAVVLSIGVASQSVPTSVGSDLQAVAAEPSRAPISVSVADADSESNGLPGAGAVIEAAQFPSLQAAFNAIPEQGGLVRLPPGRFPIHAPLLITRSNVRIEGAGPATCIVNFNRDGQPALIVRPVDWEKNPKSHLWRVQLANFRICGDPEALEATTTNPASGDGLLAEGVNELTLHNIWIDHCGGHGARLVQCYENPSIRQCSFAYNLQAGVQLQGCHDIVVTACQFEENQDALRCLDGFNLTFTGNNLDDHRGHGVVIENTYGSVISGNMIEECQGTAIVLDRDCYGITLSANVIAHNTGGIEMRDAWGCPISANTFVLNKTFGVLVGPSSGRIAIAGNAFTDSYIGQGIRLRERDNAAQGITLRGTREILISGNTFSGLTMHAIYADDQCQRIFVVGNLTVDWHRQTGGEGHPLELGLAENHRSEGNFVIPPESFPEPAPRAGNPDSNQ